MTLLIIFYLLLFSPLVVSYTDDAINLLVRSSNQPTTRRYCVELSKLPDGHIVNVTSFSWHQPHLASSAVNACNVTDLQSSLPRTFPSKTILILTEHQCKMTEHAWHVEQLFGKDISLMILTNRTNTEYDLSVNSSTMPVSIPVLVFWLKDFSRLQQKYSLNLSDIDISIDYPLNMPKKFRPAILLMFVLVFFILLAGNAWAGDEFRRKIINRDGSKLISSSAHSTNNSTQTESTNPSEDRTKNSLRKDSVNVSPKNNEPAILSMPYCIIALILCFAIGWLLLIYYFPKVMIYILQAMFCLGAFSSLTSCLDRLSYLLPKLRRHRIPSHTIHEPCTCELGPLNIFTLFAMIVSIIVVVSWYIYRQAEWSWILQDILGAAICVTIISVYRLGNMRVITLILLGFFLYDIFFVFITPYISFFQSSNSSSSTTTTTTTTTPMMLRGGSSNTYTIRTYRKVARNPSVMEQVALGFGTDGEVVPLLFALPMFIPESEMDPCVTIRKSMLGFGDVILPGILLTFCRIFDIANGNRWPIYYIQSLISYFFGLTMTHVALYLMNTAQPALLYLVPCILLSTIFTGLCRGELKELYTGRRIKMQLEDPRKDPAAPLLANVDHSNNESTTPPADIVVGISDALGSVVGVETR